MRVMMKTRDNSTEAKWYMVGNVLWGLVAALDRGQTV